MTERDKRRFERTDFSEDIEIFVNGYAVELPAKDISVRGIGLDACGFSNLKAGDTCLVSLGLDLEVPARVVGINPASLHLEFAQSSDLEVASYISSLTARRQ